ncbi:ACP S-malonyltransferase [Paenibacillus agilis]|uniref:Malonyl CoA-acyl carrier protein transacylase n=1 Tax=Paenibacillus agilis TaxID=3020863 RepID=A0A559IVL1_9BACL|nr:ACP S-malonyltransferase [Paenibacillus agilis]TVX91670.1 ACP S-malonyltransferase [Paenibacillus agilis]
MRYALLFPGQGSQYIGMCKDLIEQYPVAAGVFEEANDALNMDIRSLILNGNLKELTQSDHAQPAVVAASYALFRVFQEQVGAAPDCMAGHSLGEISALIAAEALSFANGVSYARKRGAIMQRVIQENKGRAGIVVDMKEEVLDNIIESIQGNDYVAISGYNSPNQFIVAGNQTALRKLDEEVSKLGGDFIPFRMMPMKADAPYHSALMAYLKPELEEALACVSFAQTKLDVWSTVTGKIIEPTDSIPTILSNQLILPVKWNQVLTKMSDAGVQSFIDIGPQQITRHLVKENALLPVCFSFDDEEDRIQILSLLKKEALT